MGRYIHVAELTGGLVSLTTSTTAIGTTDVHGVGVWGILGVPSIERLLGGGPAGGLYRAPPPPPPGNENPAAPAKLGCAALPLAPPWCTPSRFPVAQSTVVRAPSAPSS